MNLIDLSLMAQAENRFIRRGNSAFERGEFNEAEIDYKKALEKNSSSDVGQFNLGGAIHEQKNYEEAAAIYESLARRNLPAEQRAKSFHNLGNSLMNLQQYAPAVDAYKNALRLNPSDADTKYNLLYAQQMLRQQQQQQQQDQNQDQNKDQNQDQKQNQDQQQQQNQDQQQQQQNQQQQDGQQQDSRQEQAQGQPKQISKEDAERMLQALQNREKKTLEKLKMEQLKNAKRVTTEKDW